ncbi:MAG: FKBP-type peptidyl-prolyl cis-trans isomerase [Spirochaetaceae bacterium]|jgi:hypothetical protein|nr:FKBP-type peptidyl-prolyl cis-trans isomerase [Spirochaetaceae bacterium]
MEYLEYKHGAYGGLQDGDTAIVKTLVYICHNNFNKKSHGFCNECLHLRETSIQTKDTVSIKIGAGELNPFIEEGIKGMGFGAARLIHLPAKEAFEDIGIPPRGEKNKTEQGKDESKEVPPGSNLCVEIQLIHYINNQGDYNERD